MELLHAFILLCLEAGATGWVVKIQVVHIKIGNDFLLQDPFLGIIHNYLPAV
jgi:hypothetical protein